MARKSSRKKRPIKPKYHRSDICPFCTNRIQPDYKDTETIARFINDRARILGKARTGVCAKHQRRLTKAIERARYLALLPFSPSIE
ncbi:30S ribosomal protein S18 [Patescibacteria group bacterium]